MFGAAPEAVADLYRVAGDGVTTQTIGYLVPEFPGQTHAFFWREIQALARQGVATDLISTRSPPPGIVSHSWSSEAIDRTTYLTPITLATIASAFVQSLRAGPVGWGRCLRSIARAKGLGAMGRVRLFGLMVVGARLAALARERGWTHIHAHSCGDCAHIALFAHLLSGVTYSMTLHGPLEDYGPNQREKWRHAQFALVITKRLIGEVNAALSGFLPAAIALAPMGVEVDRFERGSRYVSWRGDGPLRIFSCARLHPGKGHLDLIEAVSRLRGDGVDAQLVIAGEDDAGGSGYRSVLMARLHALGLEDTVSLLGAVDEQAVRRELERAHLFALASLQEPLGVAIMEAMAMRVPVVVTGAGGVPELVDHGIDGLLVPPQRPDILAAELKALAHDPLRASLLAEAGRAKVETQFGSDRSAMMLAQLLRTPASSQRLFTASKQPARAA